MYEMLHWTINSGENFDIVYIPGVPPSFGQEFSKKSQKFPPNS